MCSKIQDRNFYFFFGPFSRMPRQCLELSVPQPLELLEGLSIMVYWAVAIQRHTL